MRKSKKTFLIICEGENTEPLFFNSIRDEIKNGAYDMVDFEITIRPEPRIEENETVSIVSPHKSERKKLTTRKVSVEFEEIRAPLPLKWVLEGQKELYDGTFNEVWVVFDHDNQPARKEAFEKADTLINGGKVHIAFSSICFEYYLLLHFEAVYKVFHTSECRYKEKGKSRSKPINCCLDKHPKDCFGERCVGGFARKKEYWSNSKETVSIFPLIKNKIELGFENAAWLRYVSELEASNIPIYDRNPYVTTDALVKKLVGREDNSWIWIARNKEYNFGEIQIQIKDNFRIHVKNIGNKTIIIPENSICIVQGTNNRKYLGEKLLLRPLANHIIDIEKSKSERFIFLYEKYKIMFDFREDNYQKSLSNKNLRI